MPVMGVTAVGKNMVRDAQYFRLACRIIAELGAHYVKTYYVERGFRDRHRLLPGADRDGGRQEAARARGAHHGLQRRAAGRRRRRHGAQHLPVRRAQGDDRRGRAVVHQNMKPKEAFDLYRSLRTNKWRRIAASRSRPRPGGGGRGEGVLVRRECATMRGGCDRRNDSRPTMRLPSPEWPRSNGHAAADGHDDAEAVAGGVPGPTGERHVERAALQHRVEQPRRQQTAGHQAVHPARRLARRPHQGP